MEHGTIEAGEKAIKAMLDAAAILAKKSCASRYPLNADQYASAAEKLANGAVAIEKAGLATKPLSGAMKVQV